MGLAGKKSDGLGGGDIIFIRAGGAVFRAQLQIYGRGARFGKGDAKDHIPWATVALARGDVGHQNLGQGDRFRSGRHCRHPRQYEGPQHDLGLLDGKLHRFGG